LKEDKQRSKGRMHKTEDERQRTAPRDLQHDFGFTLLEIMVAVSIIAIVLVSVYKMQAQTISMNYAARFYATAPLLAQLKLAEIEIENPGQQTGNSGDFGDKFPGYRWNVVIDDIESELLANIAENLKKIDVNVSFNNDEFTYSLRTYRFMRE
jgi:general secretion pathway protein I